MLPPCCPPAAPCCTRGPLTGGGAEASLLGTLPRGPLSGPASHHLTAALRLTCAGTGQRAAADQVQARPARRAGHPDRICARAGPACGRLPGLWLLRCHDQGKGTRAGASDLMPGRRERASPSACCAGGFFLGQRQCLHCTPTPPCAAPPPSPAPPPTPNAPPPHPTPPHPTPRSPTPTAPRSQKGEPCSRPVDRGDSQFCDMHALVHARTLKRPMATNVLRPAAQQPAGGPCPAASRPQQQPQQGAGGLAAVVRAATGYSGEGASCGGAAVGAAAVGGRPGRPVSSSSSSSTEAAKVGAA